MLYLRSFLSRHPRKLCGINVSGKAKRFSNARSKLHKRYRKCITENDVEMLQDVHKFNNSFASTFVEKRSDQRSLLPPDRRQLKLDHTRLDLSGLDRATKWT